jgi:hypothetical protein
MYKPSLPADLLHDTGYVLVRDATRQLIVLSFRGSRGSAQNTADGNAGGMVDRPSPPLVNICGNTNGCEVSAPIFVLYELIRDRVLTQVRDALAQDQNRGYKVVVTGHSLGGAIATFAGLDLRNQPENYQVDIVSANTKTRLL